MAAGRLLLGPNAAPRSPDRHGTTQNRLPRSVAPDCHPWPRVVAAARRHQKILADPASPPPSADPAHRITNRPKPRGSWRLPLPSLTSLRLARCTGARGVYFSSSFRAGGFGAPSLGFAVR